MKRRIPAWWTAEEPHRAVFDTIRRLDDEQGDRRDLNLHHLRLYSNRLAMGLSGTDWAVYDQGDKLKLNIVRTVVDAAMAQISTNKTRPMFLTEKGSRPKQVQGQKLGQFCAGQFHQLKQYDLGLDVFRDACIFGSGFEKIVADDGETCAERVPADEIVVDEVECRYRKPRQLFHVKEVSKDVLAAAYSKHADDIMASEHLRDRIDAREDSETTTTVVEAWRLPTRKGAKDGRRVVVVSNAVLASAAWERDTFPFAKFDWSTPVYGYFGTGLAEELFSLQVEINYLLQKIQRLMTLATSQVWVEKGSEINTGNLTNEDMVARQFKGRPPIFMTVAAVSPEYFAQLDRLWNRAFEISGVSQLNATSQKPAGLDSGKALRTYADQTSKRFMHVQQRWEQYTVDCADLMIYSAQDITAEKGSYKVTAADRKGIETLDFKKVNLDRDKYILRAHPVAFLPETPAGQMQTLKEFAEIDPAFAKDLVRKLEYPDVEAAVALETSPLELIDNIANAIIDDGKYRGPEPMMALEQAVPRMLKYLNMADNDGVSDERLDMLRGWITEAQAMLAPPKDLSAVAPPGAAPVTAAMPPPAPPADPAMMPPVAAPMAPPMM